MGDAICRVDPPLAAEAVDRAGFSPRGVDRALWTSLGLLLMSVNIYGGTGAFADLYGLHWSLTSRISGESLRHTQGVRWKAGRRGVSMLHLAISR